MIFKNKPLKNHILLLFSILCFGGTAHSQWTQTNGPYGGTVNCFAVSGTNLFAGISGGGVFLSTNNGTSWTAVNTGLPANTSVNSFAVSGTNLFAGTLGDGVWKRPLSEMLAVEKSSVSSFAKFSLEQNSPNPFTQATAIRYSFPEKGKGMLSIYSIDGKCLLSKEVTGRGILYWNPRTRAGGVYFCKLVNGHESVLQKIF